MPKLVLPAVIYKANFLAAVKEYQAEKLADDLKLDLNSKRDLSILFD